MLALVYDKGSTGVYFSPRPMHVKVTELSRKSLSAQTTYQRVAGEIDCSVLEVFSVRSAVYFINTITEVWFFSFTKLTVTAETIPERNKKKKTILTFFPPLLTE